MAIKRSTTNPDPASALISPFKKKINLRIWVQPIIYDDQYIFNNNVDGF